MSVRERAIAFRVSLKFIEYLPAPKDITQDGKEKAKNEEVEIQRCSQLLGYRAGKSVEVEEP